MSKGDGAKSIKKIKRLHFNFAKKFTSSFLGVKTLAIAVPWAESAAVPPARRRCVRLRVDVASTQPACASITMQEMP